MCNAQAAATGGKMALAVGQSFAELQASKRSRAANVAASLDAFRSDYAALSDRQDQVGRAASEDALSMELQALQARGQARAAATGLADISLSETLQSIAAQKARATDLTQLNRDATIRQIGREKAAVGAAANTRIAQTPRPGLTAFAFSTAAKLADAASGGFGIAPNKIGKP